MRTIGNPGLNDIHLAEMRRREGLFSQLSPIELKNLNAVTYMSAHPAGGVLFAEQQKSEGFFQVCDGTVKLSMNSRYGKTLILRIAKPGDVIGLWAAMSELPYEATALCLEPCRVAFISNDNFRRFLTRYPRVFQCVSNCLGAHYKAVCEQLSAVGLASSVLERLSRFLLDWSADQGTARNESHFSLTLTHEEIAEYTGVSRESVTRGLSYLKSKQLLYVHGSTVVIPNRASLAAAHLNTPTCRPIGPRLIKFQSAARSQKRAAK
jgi:CRP/FNR family transcriptional regulator, cyclic AMP receptor protein